MSKNDVRALIDKKANRIKSIRDRTSESVPIKEWILDFLTDVDGMRKDYRSIPSFKGAIISKVCILEAKIKAVDFRARVELEFNEQDGGVLDAIVIRWGRLYREKNNLEEVERYQVMDILLRELGLG